MHRTVGGDANSPGSEERQLVLWARGTKTEEGPPDWVVYYLMAEQGWGKTPREIQETISEEEYGRWLALNAARAEANKNDRNRGTGVSDSRQNEPGVTVTTLF